MIRIMAMFFSGTPATNQCYVAMIVQSVTLNLGRNPKENET